ncbi:hypothetical protein LGL08_20595 [Clostridium estertheticum]|uniref:hypothetical protein n=2 Tax=Clostridium estertheticum TaxID=238834 RepID=UPI001CF56359|nr:hypothetical protein [Clostridium estertheticum]MCB2351929.1 hypothetical protein [Clostridium estertheticum]
MLKVNKNINISGTSTINDVQTIYMSASISTDGSNNANTNKTISNQALYNANKAECRADMDAFDIEIYEVEDQIAKEVSDELAKKAAETPVEKETIIEGGTN